MTEVLPLILAWIAIADLWSETPWESLSAADVVVVGEVHDNPAHHANQAAIVAALKPGALVFEQLTPDLADAYRPEMLGDPGALEAAFDWNERGWPDFTMYYPIFAAAPDAAIFGGGTERDKVRDAMADGAAAVFGSGAGLFGLDRAYSDEVQALREAGQQEAHCNALPPEMLPGMVQAQTYRDAVLARTVIAAYHESVARAGWAPVVVITGNGHARTDWAVPSMLKLAMPDLAVVSIGQSEEEPPEGGLYDHWLVTEAAERPDPCEAFR